MSRGIEKWLLVQWDEGGSDVVHVRSLVNTNYEELKPGSPLTAFLKGAPKQGSFICKSYDRRLIDQIANRMKAEADSRGDLSAKAEEVTGDYSASTSSWQPSEDWASDSEEAEKKTVNIQERRQDFEIESPKNRILTPSHRANTVIPEANQRGKRKHRSEERKSHPESYRNNVQCKIQPQSNTAQLEYVEKMKKCLRDLFTIVQTMKCMSVSQDRTLAMPTEINYTNAMTNSAYALTNHTSSSMEAISDDEKENERSPSLESERSEDNMLISNKYKQYNKKVKRNSPEAANPSTSTANEEMIPIGSGKTMLSKDKYKTVNWKSYTIATRTLLLALFPRRILATHSLTGKKSPAFQNKPAKMCLDPKIISDVIIEIQQRFKVKENLIRSIITTKCADECKMFKMRQKRAKTRSAETKQNEMKDDDDDICNKTTSF